MLTIGCTLMIGKSFPKSYIILTSFFFILSLLQDYEDVQVVVLHKEVGVGLGFSLAGGVDQNKPITVRR